MDAIQKYFEVKIGRLGQADIVHIYEHSSSWLILEPVYFFFFVQTFRFTLAMKKKTLHHSQRCL